MSTITNSWTLLDFARNFDAMKVTGTMTNSNTGKKFKSCAFVKGSNVTLVGFSRNLGELTPEQITSMKHDLQVVQLESGNYKLCKRGSDSWETVNLGLKG